MGQPAIIGSVIIYAAILFFIAWRVDKRGQGNPGSFNATLIYSLSIAVYCTSWTFYGAVGTAETRGWEYLPIYLGPILIFSVGRPLLRRIVESGKRIHSTSIADFIAAHYRKSRSIAALVTSIAVIGALPYIALQLKSVATTFFYLSTQNVAASSNIGIEGVLPVALILALFATMFGTKNVDITRPNRGMIAAIAFDSIIKLCAFIAVGLFSLSLAEGGVPQINQYIPEFNVNVQTDRFITLTLLSMAAILCLPRQFHVTVVECRHPKSLNNASHIFLLYLILISAFVIPIATAGANSPQLRDVPPDLTVLALPLANGAEGLALAVFVGGFAAATAMVIVASVALSTMITNDLIAPFLLQKTAAGSTPPEIGRRLLQIRRSSILFLLGFAAVFAAYAPQGEQLASFGILSFAAAAQFIPALIGGIYWRRAKKRAAFWGMTLGFFLWLILLFMPSYFYQDASFLGDANSWLDIFDLDPLTVGVLFSVGGNTLVFIVLSLLPQPRTTESDIANKIADYDARIRAGDLYLLIQRCLGEDEAVALISEFEEKRGRAPDPKRIAGPALIAFTDEQISKAVGASSASILLKSVLAGGTLQLDDVATLLSETSDKVQFSQEILQATLENTTHGVSVVDQNLRLVAWNKAYVDMYNYPAELIQDGRPIEDLIRHNAEIGELGDGDPNTLVSRRLAHLRAGHRHNFERTRPNGMVVRIEGMRSPGGLYVTTFTDVTDYKRVERALIDSERSIRFYTDNIPALISYVDAEERFRFANNAYRRVFNLREDQVEQTHLEDILPAAEYRMRKPHIDAALNGERVTFDIELNVDGLQRYMQVAYVPQFHANDQVRGFFGIYQDVTARRDAEIELARTNETLEERVDDRTRALRETNAALDLARSEAEQATASKTRFLAAASHDLLQPLNAARLFVSALKEMSQDERETYELAGKIDASIGSADRLLRALLNISKLDAGGISPEIGAFALNELFEELSNDFSLSAQNKGVELSFVTTTLWIVSDRGLLTSALQNLVSNAVRYTDKGRILIGARRTGPEIRIDILDTGRGIPAERQEVIFQEFRRLDRDQDVSGVGLGLAIVNRIATLLGSSLQLQSKSGTGSCFSLSVPRADRQSDLQQVKTPPPDQRALDGVRVVCIDNDALVLDAMETALSRWGAEVSAHLSDQDAIENERKFSSPPDLLLVDYQLNDDRTGFDAIRTIEDVWGVRPTTIMITAAASGLPLSRAKELDMPVLSKPIEPAELRALIHQLRRQSGA